MPTADAKATDAPDPAPADGKPEFADLAFCRDEVGRYEARVELARGQLKIEREQLKKASDRLSEAVDVVLGRVTPNLFDGRPVPTPADEPSWRNLAVADELDAGAEVFDALATSGVETLGQLADFLRAGRGLELKLRVVDLVGLEEAIESASADDAEPITFGRERTCRVCDCTEDDCSGCVAKTGSPCYWVPADETDEGPICSACVEHPEGKSATPPAAAESGPSLVHLRMIDDVPEAVLQRLTDKGIGTLNMLLADLEAVTSTADGPMYQRLVKYLAEQGVKGKDSHNAALTIAAHLERHPVEAPEPARPTGGKKKPTKKKPARAKPRKGG